MAGINFTAPGATIQSEQVSPDIARQLALAQMLQRNGANGQQPIDGGTLGMLGPIVASLGAAYLQNKATNKQEADKNAVAAMLARANQAAKGWVSPDTFTGNDGKTIQAGTMAPGTGGMSAALDVLSQNPDTAPMGLQLALADMEHKRDLGDSRETQRLGFEHADTSQERQLTAAESLAQANQKAEASRQAAGFAHDDSKPIVQAPGTDLVDRQGNVIHTSAPRGGTDPASQAFNIWHQANPDASPDEVIAKATQLKATGSGGLGGGMKARYDQNMIRSGNEIHRTLQMLDQFPSGTSAGVFGNHGSGENITSWFGGKLRDEDQTDFNSTFAGADQEMGNMLKNGLGVSDSAAAEMVAGFKPIASDTNFNRVYKLANMAAKARTAAASTYPADPSATAARDNLVKMLDEFPSPEEVRAARLNGGNITAQTFGDAMRQIKALGQPKQQGGGAAASEPADGQTATNPQTGAKMIFRGGQWQPAQ